MSTVFIIQPDTGEIVEELIATANYRSPQGITVKPQTWAEEQRLRNISANAIRIKEMKEEIARLDQEMEQGQTVQHLAVLEEMRQRRRKMAGEVQRKENFSQAVHAIHRLQQRMQELATIVIDLPTSEGTEAVQCDMDTYTGQAFSRLSERLEKLNKAFQSDDPAYVKHTMQNLVEIEQELEALPRLAQQTYLRMVIRLELAQSVVEQLSEAGWNVAIQAEGDVSTPTRIAITNAIGDTAAVTFACDDQIHLETPGWEESARSALQQLVLGTLQNSGATKATGKCIHDGVPQSVHTPSKGESTQAGENKERCRL